MTNEYEKAREASRDLFDRFERDLCPDENHRGLFMSGRCPYKECYKCFADAILHLDCIEVRAENQDVPRVLCLTVEEVDTAYDAKYADGDIYQVAVSQFNKIANGINNANFVKVVKKHE